MKLTVFMCIATLYTSPIDNVKPVNVIFQNAKFYGSFVGNSTLINFVCELWQRPIGNSVLFQVNFKTVDVITFKNNKCYDKDKECKIEICSCSIDEDKFHMEYWLKKPQAAKSHRFGVEILFKNNKSNVVTMTLWRYYDGKEFGKLQIAEEISQNNLLYNKDKIGNGLVIDADNIKIPIFILVTVIFIFIVTLYMRCICRSDLLELLRKGRYVQLLANDSHEKSNRTSEATCDVASKTATNAAPVVHLSSFNAEMMGDLASAIPIFTRNNLEERPNINFISPNECSVDVKMKENSSEYTDYWLDDIHCYNADVHDSSNKYNENPELNPPVIIVGTGMDKIPLVEREERKQNYQDHLRKTLSVHAKRRHLRKAIFLSNISQFDRGEEFGRLRKDIFNKAHAFKNWGENLPKQQIVLEKEIYGQISLGKYTISYDKTIQLATDCSFPDRKVSNSELDAFLKYEYDIGNRFFEDIEDFKVVDPTAVKHPYSSWSGHNDQFADCGLWDFAEQKQFYATHQTFLTTNAVYLLVVDISKEFTKQTHKEMIENTFDSIGEYIDVWLDTIHCYNADVHDPSNKYKENPEHNPPVIIVGTGMDKIPLVEREERKQNYQDHLRKALLVHAKRRHLRKDHVVSNTSPFDRGEEFSRLRKDIFNKAQAFNNWGEYLPSRWIVLEKEIYRQISLAKYTISYDEAIQLATDCSFPDLKVSNSELDAFLRYEHDIGNIIYVEDIKDFIVLDPKWLVNVFKCYISNQYKNGLIHMTEWSELENKGKLLNNLIEKLLEKVPYLSLNKY